MSCIALFERTRIVVFVRAAGVERLIMARIILVLVALYMLVLGCSSDDPSKPVASTKPNFSASAVASALGWPMNFASLDGDSSLWIAMQHGAVYRLTEKDEVELLGNIPVSIASALSYGLVAIELDPMYLQNGYIYTLYTSTTDSLRLSRFTANIQTHVIDIGSEVIIFDDQRSANSPHHICDIDFEPFNNALYVTFGDGAPAESGPASMESQNIGSIWGKVLSLGYPPDWANVRTVAVGLRNPWRIHFDQLTGELWIGDVGEDLFEEVNVLPLAPDVTNFGWPLFEGYSCKPPSVDCNADSLSQSIDHIGPVHVYSRDPGACVAIIGGVMCRGGALPYLDGKYVFGDFCLGALWLLDSGGQVEALELDGLPDDRALSWVAIGLDGVGRLYLADGPRTTIYRVIQQPAE